MGLTVIKRDGSIVPFDKNKIIAAISKAGFIDSVLVEKIASDIENTKKKSLPVEQIQDMVEKKLMDLLREENKKVILAINKYDEAGQEVMAKE